MEPVVKELSMMYTNLESSWGFEKFLDMGKLYKWSEGWMNDYGEGKEGNENKSGTQDGFINFEIVILAVSKIRMDPPYHAEHVTPKGCLRTFWTVHELKRLCENIGPGKKLSSSVFDNDGDWYLQLYPSGYHGNTKTNSTEDPPEKKFISLYLHSSPKQVLVQNLMSCLSVVWVVTGHPALPVLPVQGTARNLARPPRPPCGLQAVHACDPPCALQPLICLSLEFSHDAFVLAG